MKHEKHSIRSKTTLAVKAVKKLDTKPDTWKNVGLKVRGF
jgi:hypothetical protein